MNIEEKDIELIEKYLEGKLQGHDYQEFKSRLEEDEVFSQSLMDMETMVSGIRYSGRQRIMQELQRLESTLPQTGKEEETKVVPMKRYRNWVAAAASILLIAVIAMWLFNSGPVAQQDLFTAYYQPYPNLELPTTRSDGSGNSSREKAYLAYDGGQYDNAVEFFANLSSEERSATDDFYWALSYLSTQRPAEAERLLEDYLERGDSVMQDQARWYLALAYLNQGKKQEGRNLLELIAQAGSDNSKKASTLLEELK